MHFHAVLDLDGVIANTYQKLFFELKKMGDCLVPDFETWNTYLFETIVPEKGEWVREQFSNPLFYKGVAPFEDAHEWIVDNMREGNRVDILTARRKEMNEITHKWTRIIHLPYTNLYHCPRVEKKYMIDVIKPDFVVEDDPRTARDIASHGDTTYLVNRSYNQDFDAGRAIRVDSVKDIPL